MVESDVTHMNATSLIIEYKKNLKCKYINALYDGPGGSQSSIGF